MKSVFRPAALGAAIALGVVGGLVFQAASTQPAKAGDSDDDMPSIVEDYTYPGGDKLDGIKLTRGDGNILIVNCSTSGSLIRVEAMKVGVGRVFCFQVKGDHGFVDMELDGAYVVWSDNHTVTADYSINGVASQKVVKPNDAEGIGTGESQGEAILLRLAV